ncbi:MAG: GAF domain-containing protein [Pseudomonadota bacterium]|nr:GAF domain-containing protein [Pseudomonadota bacterium]
MVLLRDVADARHWAWNLMFFTGVAIIAQEQRRCLALQDVRREDMQRRHAAELQHLVQSPDLTAPEPKAVFERILQAACNTIGAERAGIWLLDPRGETLRAASLHDERGAEATELVDRLQASTAPAYFEAAKTARSLSAIDARRDPRTRQLADYLAALDIEAMLAMPILVSTRCAGVLCIEHRGGPRNWTLEEASFATSLADFAAVALQSQQRARLEQRTNVAERLESLGLLAGGVAHDFNNLLTAVIGNAELALLRRNIDEEVRSDFQRIVNASQQAADLAQQMLTYAGRGTIVRRDLDLARLVSEFVQSRSLGAAGAQVRLALEPGIPMARADAVQVVQILRNLLVNAADAGARSITIHTGVTDLSEAALESCVASEDAQPGRFVYLEARDDGRGMDEETARQIFDPFFTTKRFGQGLGLAAALGTMRMHEGAIELESSPGAGIRFRFLFPAGTASVPQTQRPQPPPSVVGERRALIIDDEPLVLDTTLRFLIASGFHPIAFTSRGEFEAGLAGIDPSHLEVAVLDLTLPDGSGLEILRELRARTPTLPIVLISGFDLHGALTEIDSLERVEFVRKPFDQRTLLGAVERVVKNTASTSKGEA